MLICPSCGAENLEGADTCELCGHALAGTAIRVESSGVESALLRDVVSVLPVHKPTVVLSTTPVGEVLKHMADDPVGCVLVERPGEPGKLAGIFAERDAVLRLNTDNNRWRTEPIEKHMTANPATAPADAKIAFALHKISHGGYRHLPLMRGDRAVSIVTLRDVLRYLTDRAKTVALGQRLLGS
ncbi:MAG: CBS domain-containing protein [Planctomycetota bacterium]